MAEAEEQPSQLEQVHVSEGPRGVQHDVLRALLHDGLRDVPHGAPHGVHGGPHHPPNCSLLEWSLETQLLLAS